MGNPNKERLLHLINQGLSVEQISKQLRLADSNDLFYILGMYSLKLKPKKQDVTNMSAGLDIGTSRLLSARNDGPQIILKSQRDAFLKLPSGKQTQNALKRLSVNYIELEGNYFIVGDDAFEYAHVFPATDLRRPMASGMLNPAEPDAFPILQALIHNLLGDPRTEKEKCYYSVPAPPIDVDKLTQYHSDIVGEIVRSLGYEAQPINEGYAVGLIGLEKHNLTGLALCFGGGLANAAVLYKGLSALQLSVTKAGDFIDNNASQDTGIPKVHITALKENGELDISQTQTTRAGQAIKSYYLLVIRHVLTNLLEQFKLTENMPHFDEPIGVACAGGGVLIKGFAEIFKQEFEAMEMPFKLKDNGLEIIEDSLSVVARGCLSEALLDE